MSEPIDPKDLKSWRTALAVGRQKVPNGPDRVMLVIIRDDTLQVAAFITPDQALELAAQLTHTATEISTGLTLPPHAGTIQAG